jgi:hypothetical protein
MHLTLHGEIPTVYATVEPCAERECPKCKTPAVEYGQAFHEPPPSAPNEDHRKAFGAVFVHLDGRKCVIDPNAHQHDYSKPTKRNGVAGFECECGDFRNAGVL